MAGVLEIGGVPKFDCRGEPSSISQNWKRWKRAFGLFITGKAVTDAQQKRALLLYCGGLDMQDIFFTLSDTGDEDNYDQALQKLDDYFSPQENVPFERHQFRQMTQGDNETVDQFVTRLREKADTCAFEEKKDDNIRDQVIDKCKSHILRKKFLEKGATLTLEIILTVSRAYEAADRQAAMMESGNRQSNSENFVNKDRKFNRNTRYSDDRKPVKGRTCACTRCGRYGHSESDLASCPAHDQEC